MAAIEPALRVDTRQWAVVRGGVAALLRRGRSALRGSGAIGGALAAGSAGAVDLPPDRADAMYHFYDGGGTRSTGPALLLRKSIADKVSLSGTYYVDAVSNASIDVVTTASPYRERRVETGVGIDYAYRDALMTLSTTRSKEPDYTASTVNLDVAQEVFGGMSTVSLGFSRGYDKVGRKNDIGFFDTAKHWRYRLGVSQILTPRWIASANVEAISDDGYLGSPYRSARVFGAAVPERNPRTRSSRAIKLRAIGDVGGGAAVRGEYRYYWDNWSVRGHTVEGGYSRYFGDKWLADGLFRYYSQRRALFYSDNAQGEALYVSRNRALGTFNSVALGGKVSYTAWKVPGQYEVKLNGAYEIVRFNYRDFTDIRTGSLYRLTAHVAQAFVSASF